MQNGNLSYILVETLFIIFIAFILIRAIKKGDRKIDKRLNELEEKIRSKKK